MENTDNIIRDVENVLAQLIEENAMVTATKNHNTKKAKQTSEDEEVAYWLKRNKETQNPLKLSSKAFILPTMRCEKLIESAKKRKTASNWLKDEIKTWEKRREKYGLNVAEQQKLCILYSVLTATGTNDNPLYSYCNGCTANHF